MNYPACIIFVGPTAHGIDLPALDGVGYMPPVRRGDIHALARSRSPATVAIVDGTYHSYPAVGHRELREAMESGWVIWGLSSMGAIRAAELGPHGMKGFGQVFTRFNEDADFGDDEVALLHGVDAPYLPISEPLIHLRSLINALVKKGLIDASEANDVLDELKTSWFGTRTIGRLRQLLRETHNPDAANAIDIRPHRLKTFDLQAFLQKQPWRKETPT